MFVYGAPPLPNPPCWFRWSRWTCLKAFAGVLLCLLMLWFTRWQFWSPYHAANVALEDTMRGPAGLIILFACWAT